MSVTFAAESITTGRCTIVSWSAEGEEITLGTYGSYQAAEAAYAAVRAAHEAATGEYMAFIQHESVTAALPEVNVSNTNARDLLMVLDLPFSDDYDLYGSEDAATFRARVLTALATDYDDDATPGFVDKGEGGATLVQCDRRAGYVTDRLTALLAVAEAAEEYGVKVTWS